MQVILFYNKAILLVKDFFIRFYNNTTNKSHSEKLEKIIELLSWSNHSLSNSEKNGMCPYFILKLFQHLIKLFFFALFNMIAMIISRKGTSLYIFDVFLKSIGFYLSKIGIFLNKFRTKGLE